MRPRFAPILVNGRSGDPVLYVGDEAGMIREVEETFRGETSDRPRGA